MQLLFETFRLDICFKILSTQFKFNIFRLNKNHFNDTDHSSKRESIS